MTGNRTQLDSPKGVFPLHYHPFEKVAEPKVLVKIANDHRATVEQLR